MPPAAARNVKANANRELKSGWRRVRFGDVVRFVKEDSDPESGEFERYVAGEHIETDNLHIRNWGTIGDGYLGPAFHRRFKKGQVLYGSRRTYLRKVAVADFDGITANTTFVLEPSSDELILELLPFVMQTAAFNEHSIKQSKGSVNPYINFKDIAWFEFSLPPKDEQRRIAEMLWAADEAIESYHGVQDALSRLKEAKTISFLGRKMRHWPNAAAAQHQLPIGWRWSTIGETCEVGNGTTPSKSVPENWEDGDIPWISSGKVNDHTISTASALITKKGFEEAHLRLLPRGTIVIAMIGEGKTRGVAAILDIEAAVNQNLAYVVPGDQIDSKFLLAYLEAHYAELRGGGRGSNRGALNCRLVQQFPVPLPPLPDQLACVRQIAAIEAQSTSVNTAGLALVEVQKELREQLLRGQPD